MIAHLISSTAVALVALGAVAVLRRDRAAWRHAILLAAIIRFAVPTEWLRVVPVATVEGIAPMLLHPGPVESMTRAVAPVAAGFDWRIVWAIGTAVSLGLWSRRALRRMPAVRQATPEEREMLPGVPLRIVGPGHVPGAAGVFRQCVVLPDGLSLELGADELRAVVAHEMAHVRRRDNLTAATARVVVSIFWFHPLLWWLERRMLVERETACDETALGEGVPAEAYVSGIAKICRMSFAGASGYAGVNGSNLQRRLEHIMFTTSTVRSARWLRAIAGLAIAAAMLFPVAGERARGQTSTATRALMVTVEQHITAGRADEAVELLRQEIARDPSNRDLKLALGNVLTRSKRFDEALTVFLQLLDEIPEHEAQRADIYLRLGEVYRRQGNDTASIGMLEKARRLTPRNLNVLTTLALTIDHTGDPEVAKNLYREALTIQENGVVLNNLAYLTSQGGDLDEALALARRAKEALPDTQEVDDTLGWIQLKRGNLQEAVHLFAGLVSKAPAVKAFRDHLGLALDQRGDASADAQQLKALLRGPSSEETDRRITELVRAMGL